MTLNFVMMLAFYFQFVVILADVCHICAFLLKKLSRYLVQLLINGCEHLSVVIVGRICNNLEKNRAFYDKSMKLGTWLVDNKTKKIRVSATPKMPSNGRHLVFPKWPPFFNLFIVI